MRHILPNRCGYGGQSGYKCVGVPRLSSLFASIGLTCDYLMDRTDDWDTDVDIPIRWDKLNAYANVIKSQDSVIGHFVSDDAWEWDVSSLDALFPPGGTDTETLFAIAIGQWFNVVSGYGPGYDETAPYNVPGVDSITVTQLLESLAAFRSAWQAWDAVLPHHVASEPVYKTYFDQYMSARNFIDNYLNLPTSFRGFTTMWDYVLMMDPGDNTNYFDPPEVTCRADTDVLQQGGFMDLFNQDFFAARVAVRSKSDAGATPYTQISSSLVCFNDGVFEPGLIEPSLPVKQATPTWPVISQVESGLDGLGLGAINVAQWQNIVNLWLNDTGRSIMHLWAMREMMLKASNVNRQEDFSIKSSSGDTMWWDTDSNSISYPRYKITSRTANIAGYANVNGTSIAVPEYTYNSIGSSFSHVYFYLNFTLSNCDNEGHYGTVTAAIDTSQSGDFSVGIGGIYRLTVTRLDGRPAYYLYQIFQERNTISVELVRTCKEGLLWRLSSGAVPYKVLETAPCPSLVEEE